MSPTTPDLLVAAALISGYLFHHLCSWAYFRTLRFSGYRIFFLSAAWGAGFAVVGLLLAYGLAKWPLTAAPVGWFFDAFPPETFPYAGSAVLTLFVAWIAIQIGNRKVDRSAAKLRALKRHEDTLLVLLTEAATTADNLNEEGGHSDALLISMDDRKVYAGFVMEVPSAERSESFIKILPLVSGHREDSSLKPQFDWNYVELWGPGGELERDYDSFETWIPLQRIVSVRRFNPQVFSTHFDGEPDPPAAEASEAPDDSTTADRPTGWLSFLTLAMLTLAWKRR